MRVVVVGVNGQLGRQFVKDYGFNGFDFPEVDVTKPDTFNVIRDQNPTVIINCAAYTAVDKAESEQEMALTVNKTGATNLARLAKELDATLVQISTDYVFNGRGTEPYTEESETDPINFYGRSKLEGDKTVIDSGAKYIIARTAWLYGTAGPNFVLTMLKLAKERDELRVVTDQIGSPTWTHDLAAAIVELLKQGRTGVFNIVNSGVASKLQFVTEICRLASLKTKISEAKTSDFPTAARRPVYSALSISKLDACFQMPDWKESLSNYLKEVVRSAKI